ncbi:MAG: hypothetical protein K2X27_20995 [Candidatus Obscuribacterales bacterium]|nr:hypothetical protein [Candidatus Obscuribacterales bacterium]
MEVLTMFAYARDFFNLYVQAGSLDASADLLAELSGHENSRIRLRVAENPKTQAEVLAQLSEDPNADVRIAVALNPRTPAAVLARLSADLDPTVRLGIASEIDTAREILKALSCDENPYVANEALKSLLLLERSQNVRHMDTFSRRSKRSSKRAQNQFKRA